MNVRRVATAVTAGALVGALGLVVAPTATAQPIAHTWNQAVERVSDDATCPSTTAEEASAGWTDWQPSWQAWANDGRGGAVCVRSNTWAYEDAGPTVYGCMRVNFWYAQNTWLHSDFGTDWALKVGSAKYLDADCTSKVAGGTGAAYVTATSEQQADERCRAEFGRPAVKPSTAPNVWQCNK